MAPSPGSGGTPNSTSSIPTADGAPKIKLQQQQPTATLDEGPAKASKTEAAGNPNGELQPTEPTESGKISGKDKKYKAKAEKAARRAQDKQKQQDQPTLDPQGEGKKDGKKEGGRRGSTTAQPLAVAQNGQRKRAGSIHSKTLPTRSAEPVTIPVGEEPREEDKRVTLLEHLYGLPRRTTLVGAGKDVHPAVLALGLQMADYAICGSTARCAATLLAFRSVCCVPIPYTVLLLILIGH